MRASGYERAAADWYVEPAWIVHALLDVEDFPGLSWDPACGGGNIPKILRQRGMLAEGTDMVDRGFGNGCRDFLTSPPVQGHAQHHLQPALRHQSNPGLSGRFPSRRARSPF